MPYLQNWKMCINVDNVMCEWIMKSNISTNKKIKYHRARVKKHMGLTSILISHSLAGT